MRVGDLQQIMLQTDTVGKVQQQGAHGAELEQSKLAAKQLEEAREESHRVQNAEQADSALIRDRESRQGQHFGQQSQDSKEDEEAPVEADNDLRADMTKTGRHLNVKA